MMNIHIPVRRRSVARRRVPVVCLVAVVSLIATACTSSKQDVSSDGGNTAGPLTLYTSLGLSGSSSGFAPAIRDGIEAAVSTINANGGILQRKVKLEVDNNESSPTKAVSLLQDRMRSNRPDVVWAGTTSSETLAMSSLTTREKVIALNNGSSPELGDASTLPYSFSAGARTGAIADFLASYLANQGYKKVGVLAASDAFGADAAAAYKASFKKAGISAASETYEPDAVEMDGPLARLGQAHPDAIVVSDFVHPTYILKSRIKVGMQDLPFVGDLSTTINDISSTLSDQEKQGVKLATYKIQTTGADRPGVKNLRTSLKSARVKVSSGLYLYALAYDTVLAYANAADAARSTDPDKVRAAMEAGEGNTYPLALTDHMGWTKTEHIGSGADLFAMIPVVPLVDGQYRAG
jgi:ABC-type branched-subunit amino acid transport system substrate-binding protein